MQLFENTKTRNVDKVRICISAYLNDDERRVTSLYVCVYSLLAQTHQNLEIFIHHDGPLNDPEIANKFRSLSDKITFIDNLPHLKHWGFYHRHPTAMIEPHADWILYTNDDNYYVPKFLEIMLATAKTHDAGVVICDTLHDGLHYNVLNVYPASGLIDMGSFMTRMDVIKKNPWNVLDRYDSDGLYAQQVSQTTKCVKAPGVLFVHN
jgi:hypothetical protein